MQIAVCDDNINFLNLFAEKVRRYFSEVNIECDITSFYSGIELLNCKENFDFVFLDVYMPELSGFDIANELNKHSTSDIVFISYSETCVYESLSFLPLFFIRKSKLDIDLPRAFKVLISKYNCKLIIFNTDKGEVIRKISEIRYIEVNGHDVLINCKNDKFCVHGTLKFYENQFSEYNFVRTHKSFLVNCAYIYSLTRTEVIIDKGEKIPLSKHKINSVREKLINYIRKSK